MSNSNNTLDFIDFLYQTGFSEDKILKYLQETLQSFNIKTVSIHFISTKTADTLSYYPNKELWSIPNIEKLWLIKQISANPYKVENYFTYINHRENNPQIDQEQVIKDQKKFNYPCQDILYCTMPTTDKEIKVMVVMHNWADKKEISDVHTLCKTLKPLIENASMAMDQLIIHQRLESLLSDKQALTQRIKKDEENLRRRVLELTALHDTSNALSYTLNYTQITGILLDALVKVLNFEACSVLLLNFSPYGELIIRINTPLQTSIIEKLNENTISAISPFLKSELQPEKLKVSVEKNYTSLKKASKTDSIKSIANVPLIFKEEVIGMISISSTLPNAFSRNEMTFLHTMANQLASNLGRLKIIKELEKSKIESLIQSMKDPVMMLDEHHNLIIYNPPAAELIQIHSNEEHKFEKIAKKFQDLHILTLYESVVKNKKPCLNKEISHQNAVYSANITPVINNEAGQMGTVIVLRDITESQKAARINEQRLKVINQVNDVIQSIPNLEKLLSILMEFLLGIINASMGSIQLKQDKVFYSKVHSNFPDKIRRFYRLKKGTTISEQVINTKKRCIIENYSSNRIVDTEKIKILIDCYICLPIIIKDEVIGVVNIVRRKEDGTETLTKDDIETLSTITNLSGTAIHNAILYQEQLKKEKIDQELKVATDIQSKLLPSKLPNIPKLSFGAISIPARQIGGDYYDFFYLKDGKIGIVIADIIGKGIPAGLYMGMLKSMLHNHLKEFDSPSNALYKVNNVLHDDPVNNKFLPLIYGILDPETETFTYCNAGHEPGLFYSNHQFTLIESSDYPLGAFPDSEFSEKTLKLSQGDIIFLYTDGIIEARNKKGKSYGIKKLQKFIQENQNLPTKDLVLNLHEEILDFSESEPPHDDFTVVSFKYDMHYQNKEEVPLKIIEKTVTSSKANIKVIRDLTEKICKEIGFEDSDIFDIKLAINEAQANVIEHAYFGSEDGDILFKFEKYSDKLILIMKDYGKGTDQKTTKNRETDIKGLEGSGLGMFLINNIMDEVVFKPLHTGTELKLVKKIKKS